MKKRIGTMALACMVIFSLCMPTAKMGPEIGEEVEYIDNGRYTFETILSGDEIVIGKTVSIDGYYRLYDDGVVMYYSKQDYLYDTRENAIWLPERKDYPLKELIKKEQEEYSELGKDIQIISTIIVIESLGDTNEYAATATYVNTEDVENDPVYQNAKLEKARKEVKYDSEELKEEPIEVSFYRLLGDPWQFDGKKIQVECRSGDFIAATEGLLEGGSVRIGEIFEYQLDGEKVWKKIAKKYDPDGDKDYKYVQITAYDKKCRVKITGMFYLYWLAEIDYWIEDSDAEERGPWIKKYRYEMIDMEVHEKDREYFQNEVNAFKQSVMEARERNGQ